MTLIACFHPKNCRTILADVLITSPVESKNPINFPTRKYIPPEMLRGLPMKPAALRRKIIELAPNVVAAWAGEFQAAETLARRAAEWFGGAEASEDRIQEFLERYYREPVKGLWAIIAPCDSQWIYRLGEIQTGNTPFAKDFAVAGTGASIFKEVVGGLLPREDDEAQGDVDGLKVASSLLAHESLSNVTVEAQFGAGYEVLCNGQSGYHRVDDVLHIFCRIFVEGTNINIARYPHALRQWYEGEYLYIASLSVPEVHSQGLVSGIYIVPPVLGDEIVPEHHDVTMRRRPAYVCIHHVFDFGNRSASATLTMRGDAIDEHLTMELDDRSQTWRFSESYNQRIMDMWKRLEAAK